MHAVTDVTGFGLLGHALEMCRGAGLAARDRRRRARLLAGVEALAQAGVRTGASSRNWASYGAAVRLPPGLPDWQRDLLSDPQTSGGLLIAVAPEAAASLVERLRQAGFRQAQVVGELQAGPPAIELV